MDHPAIDEDDVVERYLRGELSPQEHLAFEQHYLYCQSCLDQLESAAAFAAAVKRTAARGLLAEVAAPAEVAVPAEVEVPAGGARVLRFAGVAAPLPRFLALAAVLLVACGLPLLLLLREQQSRAAEVARLSQSLAEESRRASVAETEKEGLARQLEELAAPAKAVQAHLLPVFLGTLRGAGEAPAVELQPAAEIKTVLLIFELTGPEAPEYRLRLWQGERLLWRGERLRANDLGLVVALPRSLLGAGIYRLEVASFDGRREIAVGSSSFRVQ